MHEYVVPDYVETEAQSDNEVVNIAPISCEPMPGTISTDNWIANLLQAL